MEILHGVLAHTSPLVVLQAALPPAGVLLNPSPREAVVVRSFGALLVARQEEISTPVVQKEAAAAAAAVSKGNLTIKALRGALVQT